MAHSAVLLTYIKIPRDFQTFVLSIFEWPLGQVTMYVVIWPTAGCAIVTAILSKNILFLGSIHNQHKIPFHTIVVL